MTEWPVPAEPAGGPLRTLGFPSGSGGPGEARHPGGSGLFDLLDLCREHLLHQVGFQSSLFLIQ